MVVGSEIVCNIAGCFENILTYVDDMILLALSWRGLRLTTFVKHNRISSCGYRYVF